MFYTLMFKTSVFLFQDESSLIASIIYKKKFNTTYSIATYFMCDSNNLGTPLGTMDYDYIILTAHSCAMIIIIYDE